MRPRPRQVQPASKGQTSMAQDQTGKSHTNNYTGMDANVSTVATVMADAGGHGEESQVKKKLRKTTHCDAVDALHQQALDDSKFSSTHGSAEISNQFVLSLNIQIMLLLTKPTLFFRPTIVIVERIPKMPSWIICWSGSPT